MPPEVVTCTSEDDNCVSTLFDLAWCVGAHPARCCPEGLSRFKWLQDLGPTQISKSLRHLATQRPQPQARISANSQSRTHAHHRGSPRLSTNSNNQSPWRRSPQRHSPQRRSPQRHSPHRSGRRSTASARSTFSRQSVFSSMALSQVGEDFSHHFGTSSSILSEIVGATGQKSVMQLGSRLPSLGMFGAASGVGAGSWDKLEYISQKNPDR